MNSLTRVIQKQHNIVYERYGRLGSIIFYFFSALGVASNFITFATYFKIDIIPTPPLWANPIIFIFALVFIISAFVFALTPIEKITLIKTGWTPLTRVYLKEESGEIYLGQIRNVMFRISTAIAIFDRFFSLPSLSEEDVKAELSTLGRKVGEDFGKNFIHEGTVTFRDIWSLPFDFEEGVKHWCDYDLDAGWGKPELLPGMSKIVASQDNLLYSGKLVVHKFFLADRAEAVTQGYNGQYRPLGSFMEGYIEGVLHSIVSFSDGVRSGSNAYDIKVTEDGECGANLEQEHACFFDFIIREGANA